MPVTVVEHPLVADRVSRLRDRDTDPAAFRQLVDELAGLLAYEALRDLPTRPVTVTTPLGVPAPGARLLAPGPLVVPVLRAGLGMLGGLLRAVPTADVAPVGLRRDEATLRPVQELVKLPDDLAGRHAVVLDPMLATGGSLAATVALLRERGAGPLTAVCLIAAPEGVARVLDACPDLRLVLAARDPGLDERAFIVPGLGDAGDRLFGPA